MKKIIAIIILFILSGCSTTSSAPKLPDTLTRDNLIETITQKNHYFEVNDKDQILSAYYFDGEDIFITLNPNYKNDKQFQQYHSTFLVHELEKELNKHPVNVGITKPYDPTTSGYHSKYGKLYTSIIKGKIKVTYGPSISFIINYNNDFPFMRFDAKIEDGKLIITDEYNVSYTLK